MRRTHADLPLDREELVKILNSELKLAPPPENIHRHFIDLSTPISFWKWLELDESVFNYEGKNSASIPELFQAGKDEFRTRLSQKLADSRSLAVEQANMLFDYLSPQTATENTSADLIFVHGSSQIARAIAGVKLLKSGVAPKILFSGKYPIYDENREPEAIKYKNYALEQGISDDQIMIETESRTGVDNVKRGLTLLANQGYNLSSVVVVAGEYYLRRFGGYWKKYTTGADIFTYGVEPVDTAMRDNWYLNEDGDNRIYAEVMKLVMNLAENNL